MAKKRISKNLESLIKKYIDSLKADEIPVKKVLLFGSYAKGNQGKWSDVDICVISPKFKDSWQATQYLWKKLPIDAKWTLEPIGFNPKDFQQNSSLITQIKKTGIRII